MRYIFGNYVLDTQRHELHRAGEPIKLRRKVFQVLAYLLAHRDRVVSKQELLAHLWPDQFVGDATLTSCIKTLRKALGDEGGRRASCARCTARAIALSRRSRMQEHLPADAAPHALAPHGGEGVDPPGRGAIPCLFSTARGHGTSPP